MAKKTTTRRSAAKTETPKSTRTAKASGKGGLEGVKAAVRLVAKCEHPEIQKQVAELLGD